MQLAAWVGLGLFGAASLVVGVRLLRLWARTRQAPERLAATALLGMGPLGFALALPSPWAANASPVLGDLMWATAAACLLTGTAAAYRFSQVVFHPGNRGLRTAVWTIWALLAICWFAELATTGFAAGDSAGPAIRVTDWLRNSALLWGGWEALRHHALLRRRRAYGLADPEATRRVLYWGLAPGGAGLSSTVDATAKLIVEKAWEFPALTLLNAVVGTLSAIFLFLAFGRAVGATAAAQPFGNSTR